ncbi:MAG: thioredoxin family protein [Bacilli bacterium]|nr:thioredoxin family protein [Bacilli bacterium]
MIIRISAMWCSSCIIMKSRFNDIIKEYDIEVCDYDYDLDEDKIQEYNVGEILPVYIKIENNKEVKRLTGEHSKEELRKFIEG